MSRIQAPSYQENLTFSRSRKENPMFRSQYLNNNSSHVSETPQIRHTFFHDQPFVRFHEDISRLRPVSYVPPQHVSRSYMVVDQTEKVGQPISAQEFHRISNSHRPQSSIITYGLNGYVPPPIQQVKLKDNVRVPVEVKSEVEEKKSGWCCCGTTDDKDKTLVNKYK